MVVAAKRRSRRLAGGLAPRHHLGTAVVTVAAIGRPGVGYSGPGGADDCGLLPRTAFGSAKFGVDTRIAALDQMLTLHPPANPWHAVSKTG